MIGCAGFPNQTSCSGMISQGFSSGPLPQTICSAPVSQNFCYGSVSQNLCSAGFVPMAANFCSASFIQTLPANQITTIQRGGNNYYVYADPSTHQVLMGQGSALRNYTSIVNKQHSSVTNNINQQVASNVINRQMPSVNNINQQATRNFFNRHLPVPGNTQFPAPGNIQLPAVANASQQAERNFAANGLTMQQRHSIAKQDKQARGYWKNMERGKHQHQVTSATGTSAVGSPGSNAAIIKELRSSGAM